jgi:hypothetical protein
VQWPTNAEHGRDASVRGEQYPLEQVSLKSRERIRCLKSQLSLLFE